MAQRRRPPTVLRFKKRRAVRSLRAPPRIHPGDCSATLAITPTALRAIGIAATTAGAGRAADRWTSGTELRRLRREVTQLARSATS
jgi:hypothetical protein